MQITQTDHAQSTYLPPLQLQWTPQFFLFASHFSPSSAVTPLTYFQTLDCAQLCAHTRTSNRVPSPHVFDTLVVLFPEVPRHSVISNSIVQLFYCYVFKKHMHTLFLSVLCLLLFTWPFKTKVQLSKTRSQYVAKQRDVKYFFKHVFLFKVVFLSILSTLHEYCLEGKYSKLYTDVAFN